MDLAGEGVAARAGGWPDAPPPQSGSREEAGPRCNIQSLLPMSDLLPLARIRFSRVPQPPQTALQCGIQVFKRMYELWGTFHIQTTTTSKATFLCHP